MNTEVGAVRAKRAFLCRPHRALSWHSIFQVTPLAISWRPYGAPEVAKESHLRCLPHSRGPWAEAHGSDCSRKHECTKARMHDSTKARLHDSTKARRHEVTNARQHEGTKSPAHEGTKARRHEVTNACQARARWPPMWRSGSPPLCRFYPGFDDRHRPGPWSGSRWIPPG